MNFQNPQCEVVTYETIQTYKGHKPERTVVTRQSNEMSIQQGMETMNISSRAGSPFTGINNNNDKPVKPIIRSMRQRTPSPILKKSGYSDFEIDCLRAHNEYRSKHGVANLRLNKKLCKFAEEWAKIIATRGNLVHRTNSPYGENIFCASSSNTNLIVGGREPVENWYSEISYHPFGKEPSTLKSGHFTQVIWKDSKELGVGQARNRSGQVFVVANYDPPGNFIGSFTENVQALSKFPETPKIVIDKPTDADQIDFFDDFSKSILKYHNEFRKKHFAPDLILNKDLNKFAQNWADNLAKEDRFAHRPNSQYGENLYCLWSSDRNAKANGKDVCRSWYDEIKDYTFGSEPRGVLKAGHFTQLVWKNSKELGVGMARTNKGKVLVVCNYSHRGNVMGQFGANVLRAR